MGWRRKAARAVSKGVAEPTDSPYFGGIIDPDVLREIDATNPVTWMRKRPERDGLAMTEANFPEAWAAGRELAKGAYFFLRLRLDTLHNIFGHSRWSTT